MKQQPLNPKWARRGRPLTAGSGEPLERINVRLPRETLDEIGRRAVAAGTSRSVLLGEAVEQVVRGWREVGW